MKLLRLLKNRFSNFRISVLSIVFRFGRGKEVVKVPNEEYFDDDWVNRITSEGHRRRSLAPKLKIQIVPSRIYVFFVYESALLISLRFLIGSPKSKWRIVAWIRTISSFAFDCIAAWSRKNIQPST